MICEVKGSLFDNLPLYSILMHQVNCLGIAGSGLAKQFRNLFPLWYKDYHDYCFMFQQTPNRLLGEIHTYKVSRSMIICSAFAQCGISKTKTVTDYDAWHRILRKVEHDISAKNTAVGQDVWTLHIPYGMGCGLGGGDWNIMSELIRYYFSTSKVKLVIHKL